MRLIELFIVAWLVLSPQQPVELRARFIGNMSFAITDGTTTVMSDFPYQSGYSSYMTYPASEIQSPTTETISLITHRHADHWEASLFQRTNWKVVAPVDVVLSVPVDRRLDPKSLKGPLRIEPLETPHAGIGHNSYVVTWHGRRLYFTGDTDDVTALLATKQLDVAFVSPWLYKQAAGRIDAKRIVIYHHTAKEQVPGCTGTCTVPKQGETIRF